MSSKEERNTNEQLKKMTALAMMSAIAFLVVAVIRIPVILFLKYEPKDVIIMLGGFIFGPTSAFVISLVSSVVEMITVSETGILGCIMNIISSCSFACTAAFIYKRKKNLVSAISGMTIGYVFMVICMLAWNYLITPIYMGYPREAVAELLIPVFLPFNLVKGALNIGITMLLYKPIIITLRRLNLIPKRDTAKPEMISKKVIIGAILLLIVAAIALLILSK